MKTLINYNTNIFNFEDHSILDIHEIERNACFSVVGFNDSENAYYLATDHLGNIPLYYSIKNNEISISLSLMDLTESLSDISIKNFITLGTLRFISEPDVFSVPPGSVIKIYKEDSAWKVVTISTYSWQPVIVKRNVHEKIDFLLNQATKRLIKGDIKRVSLALSGGIDSALTAYYLLKNNIIVEAYTASPWGREGTEAVRAIQTVKHLKIKKHEIYTFDDSNYETHLNSYKKNFDMPNGTTASLTVSALWNNTSIADNKTVFFAQNADTVFCSMMHQSLAYLFQKLPFIFRKSINIRYMHFGNSLFLNYLNIISLNKLAWVSLPESVTDILHKFANNDIKFLSLAGMLVGHTPSDGEVFTIPARNNGCDVKNIFYDVDFMEYVLSMPGGKKIGYDKTSKTKITLTKKVLLQLAKQNNLGLNYVKKGLVLPKDRGENTRNFFKKLPSEYENKKIENESQRFALLLLKLFHLHE